MLTKMLRASVQVISFRDSATSTTQTITAPSSVRNGDLLVLYDSAQNLLNTTIPTSVTPTGFTSILDNTVGTNRRIICSYKVATNSDASATITGMNGDNNNSKILLVFSTKGRASVSVFDIGYEATNNDPIAQTITSGSGRAPLVAICFIRNSDGNYSMTPTQDGVVTVGTAEFGLYKIYNSTPADVTVDTTDGGNNNFLISFYIQVS